MRNELRNLGGRRKLRPFQEMVAHWLRELGLVERFEVREIAQGTQLYRATVRTGPSSPLATLADVGFGLSQVLPVVVLLYYVPERSIVLLEQPSLHLHPAAQSALADLMLHVAKTRQLQIAFESHSEHLLRRLQRRVAEERATEEEVKLYFVSSEEGEASLSDLRLNRWGEIENWPDGFFGDEMGEIAAIAEASLSRRLGHEP